MMLSCNKLTLNIRLTIASQNFILMKLLFWNVCLAMLSFSSDITVSIFTITSESVTVHWHKQSDASSYKLTATPKNSHQQPVFSQFTSSTVMGSVISLIPNTVYTMRVEAMDSFVNILSSAETEEITGNFLNTLLNLM